MIQRIQSVYLFLAAVAMAVYAFFPAIGGCAGGTATACAAPCEATGFFYTLYILLALTVILPLVAIFKYKNLRLQQRLCKISLLFVLTLLIVVGIAAYRAAACPTWFNLLPVAAMVLLCLASRGVAHDRKLLSGSTRLR